MFSVVTPGGARATAALWAAAVDAGGSPRQISADAKLSSEFAVSPDGRGIYFSAQATHGLWWLPLADPATPAGEPRPTGLPVTGSSLSSIAVSPDGRHLGWTANESAATIWEAGATSERGIVPAPLVAMSTTGWRAGYPAVSSDGRVAFIGNRGNGRNDIFLVVPGSEPRQLTADGRDHGAPFWLAGDRAIAVIADHGDGPAFWALDPDNGQERLLFTVASIPQPPGVQSQVRGPSAGLALTRDLAGVAAAFIRDGVPNVWTMALGARGPAGPFVQRTFEKDGGSYAAWSGNGAWLAYQCRQGADSNICAIGADGRNRVQLTHDPGESFLGGWGSDHDTILFAARRRAVWNITRVSRGSGLQQALTSFTEPRFYVRYPRWDAVHARVVFERFETRGTLWSVTLPAARPQ
ncbi:MAG TPA: hypothetical protein VM032_01690 [Vicinamibacterales bacterium]|nr:hypothetical protein [Vicinamibacterales bacterium]